VPSLAIAEKPSRAVVTCIEPDKHLEEFNLSGRPIGTNGSHFSAAFEVREKVGLILVELSSGVLKYLANRLSNFRRVWCGNRNKLTRMGKIQGLSLSLCGF
jgi:hypothetical protein